MFDDTILQWKILRKVGPTYIFPVTLPFSTFLFRRRIEGSTETDEKVVLTPKYLSTEGVNGKDRHRTLVTLPW